MSNSKLRTVFVNKDKQPCVCFRSKDGQREYYAVWLSTADYSQVEYHIKNRLSKTDDFYCFIVRAVDYSNEIAVLIVKEEVEVNMPVVKEMLLNMDDQTSGTQWSS